MTEEESKMYWQDVEQLLGDYKSEYLRKVKVSPNPSVTSQFEIQLWSKVLDPFDDEYNPVVNHKQLGSSESWIHSSYEVLVRGGRSFSTSYGEKHREADARSLYLKWLQGSDEQLEPVADTSTPSQVSKGSTGEEIEPELTETKESVVNILDPLQGAFLSKRDFDDAVNRLCRYFDGETQQTPAPLSVRKGNSKRLAKALGEMHRDLRYKDSIGRDYLKFTKETFECFEGQDISNEKLTSTNLYKYMTEKG